MSTPAIDGPRSRAPLTIEELRAMALGRSARSSTISTTKACRAGMSNALITPCRSCRPAIVRHRDHARERESGERKRLHHREHLGDDDHPVPRVPVHDHAGDRREHEGGDQAAERDHAEEGRRAGQAVHEPARGDAGQPGPDQRDGLAGEEQPVVAVGEGPQRELQATCGGHPWTLVRPAPPRHPPRRDFRGHHTRFPAHGRQGHAARLNRRHGARKRICIVSPCFRHGELRMVSPDLRPCF